MDRLLRAQHGPAISPAGRQVVAGVTARLSALATSGKSFTTPDVSESGVAVLFAQRAVAWPIDGAKIARGARWTMCHDIASAMALAHPAYYRRVFGWALSDDEHWRTHSWVVDRRTGRIIEPTPQVRRAYIGVELTIEESRLLGV
jgi:alkylation response protein AidB-like acyl-CoA dehydrogenase